MSSEQVIAEGYARVMRNLLREYPMDAKAVEAYVAQLQGGLARLSTPAAGGDASDGLRLLGAMVCAAGARDWSADDQHAAVSKAHNDLYAYIRQLQDRNAEQAAELQRMTDLRDGWGAAAHKARDLKEAAESKLSALLDGIEGLEAKFRAVGDGSTFTSISMAIAADDLKALREKAK